MNTREETARILSAHPVSPEVRTRVLAELDAIEKRHDVRVLFACESGSRGWGFASPDSDYDVRFLYVHKLDWYLRVEAERDVIEVPIDDALDISGWELRKSLQLLRRSNPTLFEWLDSPIVYCEDAAVAHRLRALAPGFFSERKSRWHYLSMAKRNFRGYLQGETVRHKKYLYVLRPLLADVMVADAGLRDEINALLAVKMAAGEAERGPRYPLIHAFIEQALSIEQPPGDFRQPAGDDATLDDFLRETTLGARGA
jgi:uncharacterized protein